MKVSVYLELTRDVLENIFVTALEGGSNYWYLIEEEAIKKIREVVPDRNTPLSIALFEAVYDHNIDVEINDLESPEDVLGVISMKTMPFRLQMCCMGEHNNSWALLNEINENGDAVSSDIIFQYIVMNEVVFG